MTHDPKINPEVGDELRVTYSRYEFISKRVTRVDSSGVISFIDNRGRIWSGMCSIENWRYWARNAEVVHG